MGKFATGRRELGERVGPRVWGESEGGALVTGYLHDVQCLCVSVGGWVMGVGKQLFNCICLSRSANEDKNTKETETEAES